MVKRWIRGVFDRINLFPNMNRLPHALKDRTGKVGECAHQLEPRPVVITVLGYEFHIVSSPLCAKCTEEYLIEYSTVCGACNEPILVGNSVGLAPVGSDNPYVHLTDDCCANEALYCGEWGEGKLKTLHEIDPEKYPKGTVSVASHALNTGTTASQNIH